MVCNLPRFSRAEIPLARSNEPHVSSKRTKKLSLGIYDTIKQLVTADGCFNAKGVLNCLLLLLTIFRFALHIKHYRIGENQRV